MVVPTPPHLNKATHPHLHCHLYLSISTGKKKISVTGKTHTPLSLMAFAPPFELTNQFYSRTQKLPFKTPLPKPSNQPKTRPLPKPISAGISTHINGKPSPGKLSDPIITDQHRLLVAYQGVAGAYSEFAANTAIPNCITLPFPTFHQAISAVESGTADRMVLPVESTMEGATVRNYDLLLLHNLQIVQEINLFVNYCLLAMPGVRKAELRRVMSHPMALAHCGRTLTQLGLDLSREPVNDTAGAVELLLSQRMLDTAAIASPRAASLYGLQVLVNGLQDESWNVTRFLILSKKNTENRGLRLGFVRKTSMVVAHQGENLEILLRVLSAFSSRNVSLTKLEVKPYEEEKPSRILDGNGGGVMEFRHVFYVDFEGSVDDQNARDAVSEISEMDVFVKILGCYVADTQIYDLT